MVNKKLLFGIIFLSLFMVSGVFAETVLKNGDPVTISTKNIQYGPVGDSVFDEKNQQFLFVWKDEVPGSIKGIFLNYTGEQIGSVFNVTNSTNSLNNNYNPSVAFDSYSERFVVIWQDNSFNMKKIQIYDKDRNMVGNNIDLPGYNNAPDLDSDGQGNFLIAYFYNGAERKIYGQIINSAGVVTKPEFLISSNPGYHNDYPIKVKYNSKKNDYLVVNKNANGLITIGKILDTSGNFKYSFNSSTYAVLGYPSQNFDFSFDNAGNIVFISGKYSTSNLYAFVYNSSLDYQKNFTISSSNSPTCGGGPVVPGLELVDAGSNMFFATFLNNFQDITGVIFNLDEQISKEFNIAGESAINNYAVAENEQDTLSYDPINGHLLTYWSYQTSSGFSDNFTYQLLDLSSTIDFNLKDQNNTAISGSTINCYDQSNTLINSTVTDVNGNGVCYIKYPNKNDIYKAKIQDGSTYQNDLWYYNLRSPDNLTIFGNRKHVPETTALGSKLFSQAHIVPTEMHILSPYGPYNVKNIEIEDSMNQTVLNSDIVIEKYTSVGIDRCQVSPDTSTTFLIDKNDCSFLSYLDVQNGEWLKVYYDQKLLGTWNPGIEVNHNINPAVLRFDVDTN